MNELHKTVTEIENKLQDARGELSRFEYEFPTDSPEAQLIAELLERLDEASDPEVIEENVRNSADDYGVDEEDKLVEYVFEGDIVLSFGNPVEVVRKDMWTNDDGYCEVELTFQPWKGEAYTTTHTNGTTLRVAIGG